MIINKKTVGGFFLLCLILLIFFSKTIYAWSLPSVTAVTPQNGRLSKLEISTGVADFAEIENLYSAVAGTIEEVQVREGDAVVRGQELMRLGFDRDEAERKLREIQNSRSKLHTDIQNTNLKLERLNRYREELLTEVYTADEKGSEVTDYDLDAVAVDIRKKLAELRDARDRNDEGEENELEINRLKYDLQALYLKEDELARKKAEQEEKAKESVDDKEKSRESKLKDYEADIAALKLDLQSKNLDISGLSLQEEPYKKALEDFDACAVITAPEDGTVLSLGAGKGEAVRESQLLASIGTGAEFNVDFNVSLDNNFIIPGDECELSNASHVIKGTVAKVKPTAQGKTVSVSFSSDEATAGETFYVTFKKDSATSYTLVPNGALKQDNDGYFLNRIKRRDGILGMEYYLERMDVYIGDSDSKNTAIIQGITFFEPVALLSDKPAVPGDVISLENAGDFFEN